jgi:hypothetical protein
MSPHLTISSQLNLNPLPNNLTTQSLQQPPYICVHKQHHHRNRGWDGNLPKIDRSVSTQLRPKLLIEVHPEIPCDKGKRKENERSHRELPHGLILRGRDHIENLRQVEDGGNTMLIMFSTVPRSMSTSSVRMRTWSATSAR